MIGRRLPQSALAVLCLVTSIAVIGCLPASEPGLLTEEELAAGWISLFDDESLYGWRPVADADWKVVDGAIVVTTGEVGLLRTTTQFSDYVLKVDFRAAKGTNSGIFLRTSPQPKDPSVDCYELNIADSGTFTTGSLVGRKAAQVVAESGKWHTFEVSLQRGHVTVKLDGNAVLDYVDPKPPGRGFIGLQHNSGKVEMRNIKLKPLGLASLFSGKDLTGWVTHPDMKSVFSVTPEGHLNVKNGRGQIETDGKYGDFVLQLEGISNGKHLNSGIFFRCIPGDVMMGYESQIHNGYEGGDRTKPIDCGTGGIFRRQNARKVIADDFEWFAKTIIAEGPHIAVWVNGTQVTDWTDKREPDENPRRGLRLEPGTIMIQGHDPTTDLSFRNLRAAEMPRRWSK